MEHVELIIRGIIMHDYKCHACLYVCIKYDA
jgi:hypothetical protein